jgi:hypothetical protein
MGELRAPTSDYWSCQLPECHNYLHVFDDPFRQWGDATCCEEHLVLCHERREKRLCLACGQVIPSESCFKYFCGHSECKKMLLAQNDAFLFQSRQRDDHNACTIHREGVLRLTFDRDSYFGL